MQSDDRTLRDASHVSGRSTPSPSCGEARRHETVKFSLRTSMESTKLPRLRSSVISAAKDGCVRMQLAQAAVDGHAEASYQELEFLWNSGSICEWR
jgi:hypothetical protein